MQRDKLKAERDAALERVRFCAQVIIAQMGSTGPENLEEALGRMVARLTTLEAAVMAVLDAFGPFERKRNVHPAFEYWSPAAKMLDTELMNGLLLALRAGMR